MKAAIIDMGTNTFHLLVAEWNHSDYKILSENRIPVRIGVGGINQNKITTEGIERAINALVLFKQKIDACETENIFAFGTSALRNATNAAEVVSRIAEATDIYCKIISGDEEARFIYEGVNLALKFDEKKTLIVDIGGGSVEFIIGNGEKIFWKQSFEVGAQRLLELFQKHDPVLPNEIDEIMDYYGKSLTALVDAMKIHSPKILAGSSGTFDTLSEIHCIRSGLTYGKSPETQLTQKTFDDIYPEIISKNRAQRMQIPGMIEMRVDMIVVACCLVKFILANFSFEKIRVSSYSLKEGVLASLIKGGLTI